MALRNVIFTICLFMCLFVFEWYGSTLWNGRGSLLSSIRRPWPAGVSLEKSHTNWNATVSALDSRGKELQRKLPSFEEVRDSIQVDRRWFARLQSFILFIGYERSGHTLVSALLDAHPHIVIAHEYHLLDALTRFSEAQKTRDFILTEMYRHSAFNALYGRSSEYPVLTAGYHYQVHQWEGKCDGYIQVIGDKRGGGTSLFFRNEANIKYVTELHNIVQLPFKVMHIVRNPFDIISSIFLHRTNMYDKLKASGGIYNEPDVLQRAINHFFLDAHSVVLLNSSRLNFVKLMTAYSEDVISKPEETLRSMCDFLEVECSVEYLKHCASIVTNKPSRLRELVKWPSRMKKLVEKRMKEFTFFNRFSFTN